MIKNYKKIIVVVAVAICVFLNLLLSGASSPGSMLYTFDSTFRPNDVFPALNSSEAKAALANLIGDDSGLSNTRLKMQLPHPEANKGFTASDYSRIAPVITGPSGAVRVTIDPNLSNLRTANLNGKVVVFGQLTGSARLQGGDTEIVVGVVSIPADNKAHFTLTISAHDQYQPLVIAFGNLDPTPELVNLVTK